MTKNLVIATLCIALAGLAIFKQRPIQFAFYSEPIMVIQVPNETFQNARVAMCSSGITCNTPDGKCPEGKATHIFVQ